MALIFCYKCGSKVSDKAAKCPHCGTELTPAGNTDTPRIAPLATPAGNAAPTSINGQTPVGSPQQIIINSPERRSNGVGTAGFVFALIGLFLSYIPIAGWIIWFLGALLSIIGLFKKPRGLAIAGAIISFIDIFILIALVGTLSLFV